MFPYNGGLLAATSPLSVFTGQNMQLTGWDNANNMRNAACADTQTSMEWPYSYSLYCGRTLHYLHIQVEYLDKEHSYENSIKEVIIIVILSDLYNAVKKKLDKILCQRHFNTIQL